MPPVDDQQDTTITNTSGAPEGGAADTSTSPGGVATDGGSQAASGESSPASGGPQGTPAGEEAGSTKADEKPKSALDAVRAVLDKGREAAATKAAGEGEQPKPPAGEAKVDDKEHQAAGEGEKEWISKEQYAALPPVVRRRIGRLTEERNSVRDELRAAQPNLKAYNDLRTYCQSNGMTADDFQFGLGIMALVKNDPAEAYKQLQPILRQLQAHVGEILPQDIQQALDDGKISEAHAKELAAARRRTAFVETKSAERDEATRRADYERQLTDHNTKVTSSIEAWEQQWKASDPDYPKVKQRVWERMVVLLNEATENGTKLLTPEATVEIANRAKKDVKDWLAEALPRPREVKKGPESGNNLNTKKQPTTALEAAKLAVAATGG